MKVEIPFHRLPKEGSDDYNHLEFSFIKPSDVNVVGSYALRTFNSPCDIDMIVEIPLVSTVYFRQFLK
jgi:hypothetical protein